MATHVLQPLMAPKSVAVMVGAHADDPLIKAVLTSMVSEENHLPVMLVGNRAVNNSHQPGSLPVPELPTVPSLMQLSEVPDLLVLPGEHEAQLESIWADCQRLGIGYVLMLSWSERSLSELQALAQRYEIRLLGPNSFGVCRPARGWYCWLGSLNPLRGRLALMSQSGTIASALVDWARWQGIGFSQLVALGETADVTPDEIMDFLTSDFESQSILMYLKRVGQPTRFLSSLRAAGHTKPVAVVTEHAIGADPRVLDAALSRTGAVRGRRLNDLIAAAAVMTNARRVRQGSLLVIGNGGGPGELAAERAQELGIELLEPEGDLQAGLTRCLAGRGSVGSVTTVWASSATQLYCELAGLSLAHASCGAVLLMLSPTALLNLESLPAQILALHQSQKKLVMVCLLGGGEMVDIRTQLNAAGIPTFRTPETAIEGFQFLAQFQRNQALARQLPATQVTNEKLQIDAARVLVAGWIKQRHWRPSAQECAALLACFGLKVVAPVESTEGSAYFVRVFQDSIFGPAIGVSSGVASQWHAQAEVIAIPPLNGVLARDLIAQLHPDGTATGLAHCLLCVSTAICELPEIESLSFANVRLLADDTVAASMHLELAAVAATKRYGHLAILPYPRHWSSRFVGRSGQEMLVRPVRPEDTTIMAEFVRGLSKEARYFRFIANIHELSPAMLARFCCVDYDREMELLAILDDAETPVQVGAARYSDNLDGTSAEFAVVVADAYRGEGLSVYLMEQLMAVAQEAGIKVLTGSVLAENKRMIEFCRKLGFRIERDPDDATLVIAIRSL